jgi:hypothetical protein
VPRSAKIEAACDGFSTQAALKHMNSSLPPPHPPLQALQPQPLTASTAGLLPSRILWSQNPLHPRVCLRTTQSGKAGADETTSHQRHLHSHLSLVKQLNPTTEETPQNFLVC